MAFVLGLYFGSILCNRQIGLDVHWEFGSGNILRNKSHFTHSKILLLVCKKCLSNKPFIVTNIYKPAFHFLWFMPLKWSVQCPRVHPKYWFGHLWQLAKMKMQSFHYRRCIIENRPPNQDFYAGNDKIAFSFLQFADRLKLAGFKCFSDEFLGNFNSGFWVIRSHSWLKNLKIEFCEVKG